MLLKKVQSFSSFFSHLLPHTSSSSVCDYFSSRRTLIFKIKKSNEDWGVTGGSQNNWEAGFGVFLFLNHQNHFRGCWCCVWISPPSVCSRSTWGNLNLFLPISYKHAKAEARLKGRLETALLLWCCSWPLRWYRASSLFPLIYKTVFFKLWGSNSAALRTALCVQILFDSQNSLRRFIFFLKGRKNASRLVTVPGRNGYIWLLRFICGSTARRLYHFAFQKAKRWFIVGCFGMHQVLVRLEPPKRALKYIYIRKRDSQSKSQQKISLTFSLEIQLHWLSSASSSLSVLVLFVMDQFCCLLLDTLCISSSR